MKTAFFTLRIHRSKRLRFHKDLQDLLASLGNISYGIPSFWPLGIQERKPENNAFELN